MLLSNAAPYIKNYKLLLIGSTKIILCANVIMVIFEDYCLIYKNNNLIGRLHYRAVYCNTNQYDLFITSWSKSRICGIICTHYTIL